MQKFALSLLALVATISVASLRAQTAASPVRRVEAVMMLLRNADIAVNEHATTNGAYPDVLDGQWYVPYVVKATEMNLLTAEKETGLLRPHDFVTRAEFLSMLSKTFKLTTNIPHEFIDVPTTAWFTPYAGLAWRYKLFTGTGEYELRPLATITQEEATQAIYTLLNAEPSLKPQPAIIPNFLELFINTFRPKTTLTTAGVISDPSAVKRAVLALVRNRKNQAEHTRNELMDAVNTIRATYKLAPLKTSYYLEQAAQSHAKDMYDRGYFSHFSPEGLSYIERAKRVGYIQNGATFAVGENLAKGQLSVEQVMEDWLASETHRKNILHPEFTEIGIGLFGDIWVQEFGHVVSH